jgi:hypothetical protein
MPLMDATKMIEEYTTDFGTKVKNLSVKILEGYADKINEYVSRTAENPCPFGNLFRPRALIATFLDGTKVRYPIGNRNNLITRARQLIASNAICVDYEGEYWPYVPSTIIGSNYRSSPLGGFTNSAVKVVGTFIYTSEVLGVIVQPFAIESEPNILAQSAIACLNNVSYGSSFCTGAQSLNIKARRFRGKGLVMGQTKRTYSRDIKVSDLDPYNCGNVNAPNYYCLSYIGETIKNLHLLLPES